jgi:manganese/zinc/iron transport system ATP- binding protein
VRFIPPDFAMALPLRTARLTRPSRIGYNVVNAIHSHNGSVRWLGIVFIRRFTTVRLHYSERRFAPSLVGAPALELRQLSVTHIGRNTPALQHLSLTIAPGELVALTGPNGAGKSTILKTVAGLLKPTTGDVRIFGLPVGACHHRVAYLPQRGEIDWRFPISVERLVMTGRYVHLGWLRRPGRQDRQYALETLERLGIAHLADRQIGELSGGQQQRALIARILVQEADLILLDEPTNAIDAATRETIARVLADLRHQGRTVIMATHDTDRLGEFDRIITLRDGRMIMPNPLVDPQTFPYEQRTA